jgi:hypothetical protein
LLKSKSVHPENVLPVKLGQQSSSGDGKHASPHSLQLYRSLGLQYPAQFHSPGAQGFGVVVVVVVGCGVVGSGVSVVVGVLVVVGVPVVVVVVVEVVVVVVGSNVVGSGLVVGGSVLVIASAQIYPSPATYSPPVAH